MRPVITADLGDRFPFETTRPKTAVWEQIKQYAYNVQQKIFEKEYKTSEVQQRRGHCSARYR